MQFNDLLEQAGIAPDQVALCLHKSSNTARQTTLAIMVEERPDLFEAYQSTHSKNPEATVRNRPYFASFLMVAPRELIFIGLYLRHDTGTTVADQPAGGLFADMIKNVEGETADLIARLGARSVFRMEPVAALDGLAKRLIVADPGGRQYVRLGDTTQLDVLEIKRTAGVVPPLGPWREVILSAAQVRQMPKEWALQLAQWCGIYLIIDERDGARYVGSACGADNLCGRWRAHVAGEAGVTAGLASRDPARFRFSILERMSPDAEPAQVVRREQTWMERLDTVRFGLNRADVEPAGRKRVGVAGHVPPYGAPQ